MSWNSFHHRGDVLRAVVRTADERRDGALPLSVPGVAENFTDELDLIGALQLKWHARLSGNLERAMAGEPIDLESAVAAAWRTTAEQLPGVRMIIDRCADQPSGPEMERTMSRARDHEWIWLANAAGLASGDGAAAVQVGRRVEELARKGLPTPATDAAHETDRDIRRESPSGSLADRIKAVLAA